MFWKRENPVDLSDKNRPTPIWFADKLVEAMGDLNRTTDSRLTALEEAVKKLEDKNNG